MTESDSDSEEKYYMAKDSKQLEGKTVDTVSYLSDQTKVFKGTKTWWTWKDSKSWFMDNDY